MSFLPMMGDACLLKVVARATPKGSVGAMARCWKAVALLVDRQKTARMGKQTTIRILVDRK
jgi:hypothetical protein